MVEQELELPLEDLPKLPESKNCFFCGEQMQLLQVNKYVAFWVHRGTQLKKCHKIAFTNSFSRHIRAEMKRKQETLAKQIVKEEKKE